MTHAQMCVTDLRTCCCDAGFLEHRLVWPPCQSRRCDMAMVLRGGWVTTMTHAQTCVTDLRTCCCDAGFLVYRFVWSPCQSHMCDIAMVLRGGGSQP